MKTWVLQRRIKWGIVAGVVLFIANQIRAVPLTLQYQGHIGDANGAFEGIGLFKFALADGQGRVLWHHDGTSLSLDEPSGTLPATVRRGTFSFALGDSSMTSIPATVFTNNSLFLRLWFGGGAAKPVRVSPDRMIHSVAFAIQANSARIAEGVADGGVLERSLQPALLGKINAATSASLATSNGLSTRLVATNNALISLLTAAQSSVLVLSNSLHNRVADTNALVRASLDAERAARAAMLLKALDDLLIGTNTWTGSNSFAGPVVARHKDNQFIGEFNGKFVGDGTGITTLPSTSISGNIPSVIIPGLDASKIVSGSINPNRLPGLDASKIVSGVIPAERVPDLNASRLTTGTIADARIGGTIARTADLIATSNVLSSRISATNSLILRAIDRERVDRILALALALKELVEGNNVWLGINNLNGPLIATNAANQLSGEFSGTFVGNASNLTNLPANKVVGELAAATLPVNRLDGVIAQTNIPDLDASKITSGLINDARINTSIARSSDMLALRQATEDRLTVLTDDLGDRLVATNTALVAANVILSNSLSSRIVATNGFNLGVIAGTSNALNSRLIATNDLILALAGSVTNDFSQRLQATNSLLLDRIMATTNGLSDRLLMVTNGLSDRLLATNAILLTLADEITNGLSGRIVQLDTQLSTRMTQTSNGLGARLEATNALLIAADGSLSNSFTSRLIATNDLILALAGSVTNDFSQRLQATNSLLLDRIMATTNGCVLSASVRD